MGMMAKMRSLAPWFIITVGGLFVIFMVLSDSQVTSFMGQRSNSIGEVNGEEITYQQFSSTLDRFRQFQIQNTGREIPENQMEQFRDQVWESIVSQILMEQKIRELGLIVADDE
ncbi:MAG: SurA N-terminal domain-containing protein, partial [Melioribacteraceae bacterium]|nr:SurA N-terminal domain-containing protein [Melioribacteraceae bacterium]